MIRTVFAIAVAALLTAGISATSQAAAIAPLAGVNSGDSGQVTKVYWHHRHCWWRRGYRRCW